MRFAFAASLLAASMASPAFATQGLLCGPTTGTGPSVSVVIGSGAGPAVAGATLTDGRTSRSTMGARATIAIGQSWIDEQRLWLDLTDRDAMRYEARLRTQYVGRGRTRRLEGTLTGNGRVYRVRCSES